MVLEETRLLSLVLCACHFFGACHFFAVPFFSIEGIDLMKCRSNRFLLVLSVIALTTLLTTSLQAGTTTIVDDSFADGDFAKTGALDTPWWTSSSSSGKEISVGTLGLVTGTSGRGIHTIFPTQTLTNVGDCLKASWTFTTPTTIDASGGNSAALRFGLYDDLGQAGLNADVSASSGTPNDLYGYGVANGGPGTLALPGYMHDLDVYGDFDAANATSADLNFREHISNTVTGTGRLMATTSNFDNISPSGPDEGYTWSSNTTHTGSFKITLISATEVELSATLDGLSHSTTDEFDTLTYSLFGVHTNSNKFGSSNSAGDPDNGLDFSNIKIEFSQIPEPTGLALALCAMVSLAGMKRRR
jgi:hypothetical protein